MADPEPSAEVGEDETIARHCRHDSDMRRGEGKGKYKMFMPPHHHRLSVFRTSGITEAQIRQIGEEVVSAEIKGHASLTLTAISSRGLTVQPAPEPHPRHANVIGWSADDEVNRLTAHGLANASQLTAY